MRLIVAFVVPEVADSDAPGTPDSASENDFEPVVVVTVTSTGGGAGDPIS